MEVLIALVLLQPQAAETVVVRCVLPGDPGARAFELRREGDGESAAWTLVMSGGEAGSSPVRLPLPGAAPEIGPDRVTLDYQTQNGGRDVEWRVGPGGATLDVHANFELEVNIEPDLDPRVELMNTNGVVSKLSCLMNP
jgi:hypothetical protein